MSRPSKGYANREDIKFLMPLIEAEASRVSSVLEIGPEFGNGSTRSFQKAFLGRKGDFLYVTVDIVDNIYPEERPILPFWHFVLGDSREDSTADKVENIAKGRKFDLIFIDTIHNYDFLKRELEVWKRLAHEETVWLFHDTYMHGTYNPMTDAIKEFANKNPTWKYKDLSKENNGLGALIP